jgi:CheY-like chemotaxis protein
LLLPVAFAMPDLFICGVTKDGRGGMPMDRATQSEQKNNRTALIVEDNMACVYLWRRYTMESGFRPITTASGREALELAQREHPSLVVLDVMLPDIQGWEVLHALKADPATRDIPVLVCSGFFEEERSMAEGADGYLQKPVLYDSFLAALETLQATAKAP